MGDLESWHDEMQSAYLYHALARREAGTPRESLFLALAREASDQAAIWARRASEAGQAIPAAYRPDVRAYLVEALIRWLGPRNLHSVLVAMKVRGLSVYSELPPDLSGAPASERPARTPTPGGLAHSAEAEGRRHRGVGSGGNLRAAVFGVSDGLVSSAGLVLGVAGATSDIDTILLSGVAGLLAGAFSMAAGEYVSVRSQRELFEYQIDLERRELEAYPDEEAAELALIYEARGIPREEARNAAKRIVSDPERALDALAREELGLDPEQLGSPLGAARSSFLSFAAGAALPVAPFALASPSSALAVAIGLSAFALFCVGSAISLFTGRSALEGGLRMLGIGGAAGGATYAIGSFLGVSLS